MHDQLAIDFEFMIKVAKIAASEDRRNNGRTQ